MNRSIIEATVFQGSSLSARRIEAGVVELCFDRQDGSPNKLDRTTIAQLNQATTRIVRINGLTGLLITSANAAFVVGADIKEFLQLFAMEEAEVARDMRGAGDVFRAIEDLPVPTIAAINGYALGGGFELALACSMRVMASNAQVGLPEVKLGLVPGAGGHVRLPRVAGSVAAIEWITSGRSFEARAAVAVGAVDDQVDPADLRASAMRMLSRAMEGEIDWQERRRAKCAPVAIEPAAIARAYAEARRALTVEAGPRSAGA